MQQGIGIDIGYGRSKINTGAKAESYPSIVGNHEAGISIGFERRPLETVEIDGKNYLVGDSAIQHSSRHYQGRDRDWITTEPIQGPRETWSVQMRNTG